MDKINKVIIADSQFLVVEALRSLIMADRTYSISGVVATRQELLKLLDEGEADLLITDYVNIDYDGIDDLRIIRQTNPRLSIPS